MIRYLMAFFVFVLSLSVTASDYRSIKNDAVIFYKEPNHRVPLFMVNKGFPVKFIRRQSDGWARIEDYSGNRYWVANNQLMSNPRTLMTLKDRVQVYESMDKRSPVKFTLVERSLVNYVGQSGKWVEVAHQSGTKGYAIAEDFFGVD